MDTNPIPSSAAVLLFLGSLACARVARDPAEPPRSSGSQDAGAGSAALEPRPAEFDHEHTLWTEVLRQHVHGDDFDYGALKKEPAKLEAYLKELHAVTPEQLSSWTREQRFAFWINVYNAHTIQKVIGAYPLESIKDLNRAFGLKSVFDDEFIPMRSLHPDGKDDDLSLNDVEHEILRDRFQDARVHAAINCASASCPPLRGEAFVASRLDEQLDEQMRAFIHDESRNRFDARKKELRLSEIFKWFEEDFERDTKSVREYLLRYVDEDQVDLVKKGRIRYIDYDWSLNDYREEG